MDRILWWIFYFATFYAFIPGFVSRVFGFRAFRRGKAERELALTFDDGPDPVYTPRLLDLLKREGAKATFFVVGAHAEQNPELIRRMHEEGHTLGIHNYVHRSNWIMSPRSVKKQVQRTSDIIEGITGVRPRFYRPPWGIVNVFDFAQLRHFRIVLWTSMFGDWKAKVGTEKLYRKMRERLHPGQVFLLHDRSDTFGADPEAPAHTIAALERLLKEARERGLRFVGIERLIELTEQSRVRAKRSGTSDAVSGADAQGEAASDSRPAPRRPGLLKRIVVALWMQWEKLFHVAFRVRSVGDGSFMHYRIVKYSGPTLTMRDQSRLVSGDRVFEMHFDNAKMYEIGMAAKSTVHIAIRIIREVERVLPDMAREFEGIQARSPGVKALYGVSMINRGSEGLGFDTFPLPRGMFAFMTDLYLKLLLRVIHPDGGDKISRHGAKLEPRMIVMSGDVLKLWNSDGSAESVRRRLRGREAGARPDAKDADSKDAGKADDDNDDRAVSAEEAVLEPMS